MSRNSRWLSCTVTLLLSASVFAGPMAKVPEASFDFGKVGQGTTLTHTFWIKSVGSETLRVLAIWPGCGCTQIPMTDSTAAPGDSIPISIIFRTERQLGKGVKNPEITTNASDQKIKFDVMVDVVPPEGQMAGPLFVSPVPLLDVSQFGEKTRRRASFQIENRSAQDLSLVVVDTSMKSFEIKLPNKVAAGETVEGMIRVRENRVAADFEESFTFKAANTENATYTVPVRRLYRPNE
jgi:hypothetical protein